MSWITQLYTWLDRMVILKFWAALHRLVGKQVLKRTQKYTKESEQGGYGWKEQAMTDFRVWLARLDELPENVPLEDETSCDLYTLLAEFLALKKQIQIQNREQSRQIRGLKGFNEFSVRGSRILDVLDEKVGQLDMMMEKAMEEGRMETIKCFLDVRDPLVRGALAAKNTGAGFFWTGREKRKIMVRGYEMALRKLDHAFAMTLTFPVKTGEFRDGQFETGQFEFDPAVMTAVDTRAAGREETGMVLDEVSSGFIRNGKVIRPAQVIVSK